MQPIYNIPVIPPNLQREETVVQVAEVLEYLNLVTEDIFKRINDRINCSSNNLDNIAKRINSASKKVDALTGVKKATQVFSSSKYPAVNINARYKSMFECTKPMPYPRHSVNLTNTQLITEENTETLQFYHVMVKNVRKQESYDGLGGIPRHTELVNDLLLYNTGKNPYKQYVMSDTLLIKQKQKENEIESNNIGAAPLSIADRSGLPRSNTETYFYSPDLGDVPAIDVPLDLPDLPGIADDLRYVIKLGPAIAPSVTTTPNVPDLPEIITNDVKNDDIMSEAVVLPPPPSPPVEINEEIELPPPEVVVIPTQVAKPIEVIQETSPALPVLVKQDSARANLMEAIRKAGGSKNAKLRSTETVADSKKLSVPSGDLMADLHAKLSMRRKGISGTKNKNDVQEPGNAMDRISAMIPPPPPINDISDVTNTEDEDWD